MKCPGQDTRYWKPEAIFEARCPKCGETLEFFRDDTARTCRRCGHKLLNPKLDFSCASYCPFAEQCLGSLSSELLAQRESLLKDRVALEVKRRLGRDFERIGHAARTLRLAEQIAREEGGSLPVLLTSASLRQVGENPAETLAFARETLTRLGAREDLIAAVCALLEREGSAETREERILADADRLARLETSSEPAACGPQAVEESLRAFHTPAGRHLARVRLCPSATGGAECRA
jgi:hypothetical protein